jgi:hypothetical protein
MNYDLLIAELNNELETSNLVNFEVVSLGNPQSTGIVKCFRTNENNNVVITYELFRIVNEVYTNSIIENYI